METTVSTDDREGSGRTKANTLAKSRRAGGSKCTKIKLSLKVSSSHEQALKEKKGHNSILLEFSSDRLMTHLRVLLLNPCTNLILSDSSQTHTHTHNSTSSIQQTEERMG